MAAGHHRTHGQDARHICGNAFVIDQMVEKPKRADAFSILIISCRYILQPEIFQQIASQPPSVGGEIQVTDAMIHLMERQSFHGLEYQGTTYDCGDKVGFLRANVAYGLEREDIGEAFRATLLSITDLHGGKVTWSLCGVEGTNPK